MTQEQFQRANEINSSIKTLEYYGKLEKKENHSAYELEKIYKLRIFEIFKTEIEEMITKKLKSLKNELAAL